MPNPAGLTELAAGDIIIGVWFSDEIDMHALDAEHGLIYLGQQQIIHSQAGNYQLGVKAIDLTNYFKPNHKTFLGEALILRPKRENLGQIIARVAARWDSKITYEEAVNRPKDELNVAALLPTPYMIRDQDDQADIHTLFRAFRANQRNMRKDYKDPYIHHRLLSAQPLSITQGVSCSNFVGYCYQAALIELSYPNGLPASIQQAINKIERYKKSQSDKKLGSIPDRLFLDLQKAVIESGINKNILDELNLPLKGEDIQAFLNHALTRTNEWEMMGFLCYVPTSEKEITPFAMKTETLKKLLASTTTKHHHLLITEDELRTLSLTSQP